MAIEATIGEAMNMTLKTGWVKLRKSNLIAYFCRGEQCGHVRVQQGANNKRNINRNRKYRKRRRQPMPAGNLAYYRRRQTTAKCKRSALKNAEGDDKSPRCGKVEQD